MVSTAVTEQIKAPTSDSQKNAGVTNVASPMAQSSWTEGEIVALTNQTDRRIGWPKHSLGCIDSMFSHYYYSYGSNNEPCQ